MAKPIEPTPILKGADAARLLKKSVSNPVSSAKKKAFLKACDSTYRALTPK
jgi:hypothetical protein